CLWCIILCTYRQDSSRFPYTTLFRSRPYLPRGGRYRIALVRSHNLAAIRAHGFPLIRADGAIAVRADGAALRPRSLTLGAAHRRSEEHTSELQSRENLVCRLLLEKKK